MNDASGKQSNVSPAVETLIALENSAPAELWETTPGSSLPLWPQVRTEFGHALSENDTGSIDVAAAESRTTAIRRLLSARLPNRWDARSFRAPRDICFIVGGGTITADSGRYRNWLVDDFADRVSARSVVLQWKSIPSSAGIPVFRPTRSLDPLVARSSWWLRNRPVPPETAGAIETLIRRYVALGEMPLPEDRVRRLVQRAVRREGLRVPIARELDAILDRVRPRVVVMDNASYGHRGAIVAQLKQRGIHVAEPQHGWIGRAHVAYNFGAAFADPVLSRLVPDELLTFGPAWSDSVAFPGLVTAIGKPHLEQRVRQAPRERERELLVISSRAEPFETDEFVFELRSRLDSSWAVRFRPHPAERASVAQRYPRLSALAGVEIDTALDVYDSLARARVVVGVASTVLFEAAAFGCSVIVRDTAFADRIVANTFGARVRTAHDVTDILSAARSPTFEAAPDQNLWASRAVDNFAAWSEARLSP